MPAGSLILSSFSCALSTCSFAAPNAPHAWKRERRAMTDLYESVVWRSTTNVTKRCSCLCIAISTRPQQHWTPPPWTIKVKQNDERKDHLFLCRIPVSWTWRDRFHRQDRSKKKVCLKKFGVCFIKDTVQMWLTDTARWMWDAVNLISVSVLCPCPY